MLLYIDTQDLAKFLSSVQNNIMRMKTLYCPIEPLLGSMLMLPQSSINYIAIFILAMLIISMKNGFPQTMNHGFY